jgi:hypothetical protein
MFSWKKLVVYRNNREVVQVINNEYALICYLGYW